MEAQGFEDRFVIVSPVRDEARHIEKTVLSVLGQTVRPVRWVIVDDGSTDGTPELVERFTQAHDWISLMRNRRTTGRLTGTAEAAAFKLGADSVNGLNYDFIVKLDGDVVLEKDYFERLLSEFNRDKRLGIASGYYLERRGKDWEPVRMPEYHAAGATKMLRKRCFAEIGGFLTVPGWDTVDEIKAQFLGWRTRHFRDIGFFHLRNEGAGMGHLETNLMHGEIYYLTGGSKIFFTLKLLHRFFYGTPFAIGALVMLAGFLKPAVLGKKLLVSRNEARFYRRLLLKRLVRKSGDLLNGRPGQSGCAGFAEFII